MSKKILLQKATRVEGNADIHIELEQGRVTSARFMVQDFRGFETFACGNPVGRVPSIVSRICGLCSSSHQIAGYKAIENGLGITVPQTVTALRKILLLGEWISSHALSYFFLSSPEAIGENRGIFDLMQRQPELAGEAFFLRRAGQRIVELLGKRAIHPVSMDIGRFLMPPDKTELEEVSRIAEAVRQRSKKLIADMGNHAGAQTFPLELQAETNFLSYDDRPGKDLFSVRNRAGELVESFTSEAFEENISEMRVDWSFAKFPYLSRLGFPEGMLLVGPASRSFAEEGILDDPDIAGLPLTEALRARHSSPLDTIDTCRLLEICWAAGQIQKLLAEVDLSAPEVKVDATGSGKGIGVVEAPRGVLVHSYLVNKGILERMRLLVATQFNNAFMNLLLKDLAESFVEGDSLSPMGQELIGRCIRIFDPCLSCATH
jgi:NAD-reducing hydrogenase large subunit